MPDNPSHPSDAAQPLSREQRLAAKLRENLRRRKTQARGMATQSADEPGTLPKSPGKS